MVSKKITITNEQLNDIINICTNEGGWREMYGSYTGSPYLLRRPKNNRDLKKYILSELSKKRLKKLINYS